MHTHTPDPLHQLGRTSEDCSLIHHQPPLICQVSTMLRASSNQELDSLPARGLADLPHSSLGHKPTPQAGLVLVLKQNTATEPRRPQCHAHCSKWQHYNLPNPERIIVLLSLFHTESQSLPDPSCCFFSPLFKSSPVGFHRHLGRLPPAKL